MLREVLILVLSLSEDWAITKEWILRLRPDGHRGFAQDDMLINNLD